MRKHGAVVLKMNTYRHNLNSFEYLFVICELQNML